MPKGKVHAPGSGVHRRNFTAKKRKRFCLFPGGNPSMLTIPSALRKIDVDTAQRKAFGGYTYSSHDFKKYRNSFEILKHHVQLPKFNPTDYNKAINTINAGLAMLQGNYSNLERSAMRLDKYGDRQLEVIVCYESTGVPENGFFNIRHYEDKQVSFKKKFNLAYLKGLDQFGFVNFGWSFHDNLSDPEVLEYMAGTHEHETANARQIRSAMKWIKRDAEKVQEMENLAKEKGNYDELLTFPALTEEGLMGRLMWLLIHTGYYKTIWEYRDAYGAVEHYDQCFYDYWSAHPLCWYPQAAIIYERCINQDYSGYGGLACMFDFTIYKPDGTTISNKDEPFLDIMDAITSYDFKDGIIYGYYNQEEKDRIAITERYVKAFCYLDDLYRRQKSNALRGDRKCYEKWLCNKKKTSFPKGTAELLQSDKKVRSKRVQGLPALRTILHQHESVKPMPHVENTSEATVHVL